MVKPDIKHKALTGLLNTPLGLVVALGAIIMLVELLIMTVVQGALIPTVFSEETWSYIDATLLTIIVAPLLYFLVFQKMQEEITERKRAEEALIAAKNEAERANLAKSQFLSSMSHELRTPMNAVLGFAQLIEMDASLPEEHKSATAEILKAGKHLLELINELLNLAKIESGNIELSIGPVTFSAVANECLTLVRPLADAQNIRIESADFSDIVLRADPMRLKQVLINLLSNAVKFNHPNGAVKLHFTNSNNLIRIMVSDTGSGIAHARMGELFQPFNRLGAEGGNIQGSGIGLTISQHLIELMGGKIGVESSQGTGSTFWIELPQEQSESATAYC